MFTESIAAVLVCPRCGAENPPATELCQKCLRYLGRFPTAPAGESPALARLPQAPISFPEATPKEEPDRASTIRPDISNQQTVRNSFLSSLGAGCGSLILANIITNVLVVVIVASGIFRDVGTLLCVNLVLLGGIATALLQSASQARQRKGQGSLDTGAIATAVGIFILIQIVVIPLLQSGR